ncbi:MAG TPA: DUF2892 domain-containing protein [Gemmatimonadales bacterium]|nr:DUF2892 domain-containing protein [Gemmatimonadales bacterium]
MKRNNIGGVDTAIRAVLGSVAMVWAAGLADAFPFLAVGIALVATVILATAVAGVCPFYSVLGIDTRPSVGTRRTEADSGLAHQLR